MVEAFSFSTPEQLANADIQLKKGNTELREVVIGTSHQRYTTDNPSNSLQLEMPLLEIP